MSKEIESDMNILQQSAFDIDLNLDPLWCSWFSGWIDGEGSFYSNLHHDTGGIECSLAVKVRDDDAQLIRNVRDVLRCGVVRQHKEHSVNPNQKGQIIWACGKIGECRHILIPLLDKYPPRSKKRRDYEIWRKLVMGISDGFHLNGNRDYIINLREELRDIKRYTAQPTMNISGNNFHLDTSGYAWLSGWVDGEGYLGATPNKGDRSIQCYLRVKVRDDDAPLICAVRDFLGCGGILHFPAYGKSRPSVEWFCNTRACREILIPIFDKYELRSKKSRDYGIWREIIMLVSEKHHLDNNRDYVLGLCRQLRNVREYSPSIPANAGR